jgi:low temperature requirement protein LtrA
VSDSPGSSGQPHQHRLSTTQREHARVTPLELFFDLVFVLVLTQCTALMADVPTVQGVAQAMLVLGAAWWSWVGYAWLTSVIDPDEPAVRLVVFVAMAAFLVCALCVPGVFGGAGVLFALAYAVVRVSQIALFVLASHDDPRLRSSVIGLGASTAAGVTLLGAASQVDGRAQAALWAVALLVDLGGPFLFGAEGWRLEPEHFAERHALIVIIALGESVVAIGAGVVPERDGGLTAGVVVAAVVGSALAAGLWWLYFDVHATVGARRLEHATPGLERNELARDGYSYLHLPMVAGVVLVALGMKKTLGHVDEPLAAVPAFALLGGTSLYLLALVAFRLRMVRRWSYDRLAAGVLLLLLVPVATLVDALVSVIGLTALLAGLVAYETVRFAELRGRLREHPVGDATPRPDRA